MILSPNELTSTTFILLVLLQRCPLLSAVERSKSNVDTITIVVRIHFKYSRNICSLLTRSQFSRFCQQLRLEEIDSCYLKPRDQPLAPVQTLAQRKSPRGWNELEPAPGSKTRLDSLCDITRCPFICSEMI